MRVPCWLTMALKYLHARMAALRVLGPSSVWFLAAVARMSRASSSGERGFFPSSVADVALMARSLHESKQQKLLYKDARSLKSANRLKQNKETTTTPKATTRKSPSQTCVSPAEKAKQKAGKHQHKRGQSPNENTHRIDLHMEAVENPLYPYQKHASKRIMCRSRSGRHKDSARWLTLA